MLRVTSCGEQSPSKANAGEGGGAPAASVRASSSAQAETQRGGGLLRTLRLLPALLSDIHKVLSTKSVCEQSPGLLQGLRAQLCPGGWGVHAGHSAVLGLKERSPPQSPGRSVPAPGP